MIHIELVTIGKELLSGLVLNTNASFICHEFAKIGFDIQRHQTLSDDKASLKKGLEEALERSDLVITTGGLGPTCDDETRAVVASIFASEFEYNAELAADLYARYGETLISIKDQATVPKKAILITNPIGTASGLIFARDGHYLACLPGVPKELTVMVTDGLLPFVQEHFPLTDPVYRQAFYFCQLAEMNVDAIMRPLLEKNKKIDVGIYPSHGNVSVVLSTRAESEFEASKIFKPVSTALEMAFSGKQYKSDSGKIEEAIHQLFLEKGYTLSLAESCTGGSIAARLSKLSGASGYFLGGVVAYDNSVKEKVLGVPKQILERFGAVSKETVCIMAKNVREIMKTDYSIAVSGIAGPTGGTEEKPIGMVWAAICSDEFPDAYAWVFRSYGSREMVIESVVNKALGQLWILSSHK